MISKEFFIPFFCVYTCNIIVQHSLLRLFLSCWRLVHKETTPFGPVLWLSVAVDQPTPLPTVTPSQPPVKAPLTNDNLLCSIGFIPSGESPMTSVTFGAPPPAGQEDTTSFQSECNLLFWWIIVCCLCIHVCMYNEIKWC